MRLPYFHSTPLPFEVTVTYPSKVTIGSTFELLVSIRNATTRKVEYYPSSASLCLQPHVLSYSVDQSAHYLLRLLTASSLINYFNCSGTVRGQLLLLPSELQVRCTALLFA